MLGNFVLQGSPVVQVSRSYVPHVELEGSFANRGTFICFIRTKFFSNFTACLHGTIIEGLEDLNI